MKKLLVVLVLVLGLLAVIATAVIVITPRVTRLDPVKVAGDALTGYGANSDRHKNARQLPRPWDPVGDANRRVEAIPMEDRAYPLIAEAAAMLEAADVSALIQSGPDEPNWAEAQEWVKSEEAQKIIETLLEAVRKPAAGFPASDSSSTIWNDTRVQYGLEEREVEDPKAQLLSGLQYFGIRPLRDFSRVIDLDLAAAAQVDRGEKLRRAAEIYFRLAAFQYEITWPIDRLVSAAIVSIAVEEIEAILLQSALAISENDASLIETEIGKYDQEELELGLKSMALGMEEQIRSMVDESGVFIGAGNIDGKWSIGEVWGRKPVSSVSRESFNRDLLKSLEEYEHWVRLAEDAVEHPYASVSGFETQTEQWAAGVDSIPGRIGRELFEDYTFGFPKMLSVVRLGDQRLTALRLALAAHRHRLRHGDPPLGLADIDDDLITFDPVDGFTGGPMQFRWRDGTPFVYTYGPDQDDDGGRHVLNEDGEPWGMISDELLESAPDGDFVLFPSPIE